jgi:dolichol-phosphate mannosyltransferase
MVKTIMIDVMVVIPTFNEAENVGSLIETLLALPVAHLGVLIVDDNSPDGTGQIVDEFVARYPEQVYVIHREGKLGFGSAYIAGFRKALAMGAAYIIQCDCDFSHNPEYIPQMINDAKNNDVVIGSRYIKGGSVDKSWGVLRKLLSWFANSVYVPAVLNIPLRDGTGGYRLWRRQTLQGIGLDRLAASGFIFQVETAYIAYRLGYRISEIPIYFPDRERGTSKMSLKIQIEAALRVWQLRYKYRTLDPQWRHEIEGAP